MKQFKPMRAAHVDYEQLVFPVYASPKLDGVRCVIKDGVALSNSLKPIPNAFVQQIIGRQEFNGLDGELIVGEATAKNVFNVTQSGVMSVDGCPDFRFVVFDYCESEDGFAIRHSQVMHFYDNARILSNNRIVPLLQQLAHNQDELTAYHARHVNDGYEGTMIRRPDGIYKYGRSTVKEGYLLKVKDFADDEAVIVGYEELMHNNNEQYTNELGHAARSGHQANLVPSGRIGAYWVRSPKYEKDFKISCGSMTHEEQAQALQRFEMDKGCHVRFKYFPHGGKDVPRHGLFAGYRHEDDLS